MILEQRKTLERAIPPLVKRFGVTSKRAWAIIENQDGSLEKLLLSRKQSATRQRVNKWWKQHRSRFRLLGLGAFQKVARPAKLPESTYDQVICLVWLTDKLSLEQFAQRQKKIPEKIKEPRFKLWQWIKKKTVLLIKYFRWYFCSL